MKIINDLSVDDLYRLVEKQLYNLFEFDKSNETKLLYRGIDIALKRIERNFANNKNKYYSKDGKPFFNPFHSGQYTIFLYYLSNTIKKESGTLADRIYFLNKALNAVDLFYEIELPEVFFLEHPVGAVMGRAEYANFFNFSQNCTVGNNKGVYPKFGEYVTMLSGSKVIGDTKIGKHCIIAANTYIKDTEIPDNSIVFGSSPDLIIKRRTKEEMDNFFAEQWRTEQG
ncbi:transferase [Oceanobacillus saliphilus]|uniref:transferase n=1 Tax=Oceanobacillus saliphilus TaxID=2925834 RepID=UPI00201DC0D1|nr:transferase [Oceanobacillus saliphilus]